MLACMSRHRQGRGDHDHALILDQAATSQISAATRIATNSTTTMTAAGIVRSLWSCLCTSVLLAVDGAEHGVADRPGAARWRLPLPRAALAVAEPTLVRSGAAPRALRGEVPATPPVRPLLQHGEAGRVPLSMACCAANLVTDPASFGSGRYLASVRFASPSVVNARTLLPRLRTPP